VNFADKELNLISWNEREPKYDIREWSPDHEKMGKGVTLSEEEIMVEEFIKKPVAALMRSFYGCCQQTEVQNVQFIR